MDVLLRGFMLVLTFEVGKCVPVPDGLMDFNNTRHGNVSGVEAYSNTSVPSEAGIVFTRELNVSTRLSVTTASYLEESEPQNSTFSNDTNVERFRNSSTDSPLMTDTLTTAGTVGVSSVSETRPGHQSLNYSVSSSPAYESNLYNQTENATEFSNSEPTRESTYGHTEGVHRITSPAGLKAATEENQLSMASSPNESGFSVNKSPGAESAATVESTQPQVSTAGSHPRTGAGEQEADSGRATAINVPAIKTSSAKVHVKYQIKHGENEVISIQKVPPEKAGLTNKDFLASYKQMFQDNWKEKMILY